MMSCHDHPVLVRPRTSIEQFSAIATVQTAAISMLLDSDSIDQPAALEAP